MSTQFKKQRHGGLHLDVSMEQPVLIRVGSQVLAVRILGKNGKNKYTLNFKGSKDFEVYTQPDSQEEKDVDTTDNY